MPREPLTIDTLTNALLDLGTRVDEGLPVRVHIGGVIGHITGATLTPEGQIVLEADPR